MIVLFLLFISLLLNILLIVSLKKSFNYNDILESWIIDFKNKIDYTYKKLKEIDNRGIFEKDDDVGFLFREITNLIKSTNEKIQQDDNDTEKK